MSTFTGDNETGTIVSDDIVECSVDFQGNPSVRSASGGWRSSGFTIGAEMAEKFAYFGVASNLMTYFTGPLQESTAVAASNVNLWLGTAAFLPLIWGSIADSFLGRFRTILLTSSFYIMGLGLLTYSATIPDLCGDQETHVSCVSQVKVGVFFCALYLIALGEGGFKVCLRTFGADQFDEQDPVESKAKSSYFNWLYFAISTGIFTTRLVINYVQENLSWALGYGIPCFSMILSLFLFLLGIKTYRFNTGGEKRQGKKHNNPFVRIGLVLIAAAKNRRQTPSDETCLLLPDEETSNKFRFLDRAVISCGSYEVEEAKTVLSLIPIWMCSLVFGIVYGQSPTFFTKQGSTMDRSISSTLIVPAATLQCFISLAIIFFIPIYDRLFVPIVRSFTHKPAGITTLQRISTGIFLSIISMATAALVEMKRLKVARDHGLVGSPDATVPMSVCWLIPQYVLFGVSDVFTMVGLQEFFYGQIPVELRSMGLALYLSIIGIGNFLSSFMVSVIEKATSQSGQPSWFDNNLNQAHLDYFYWLLACLSSISFVFIVHLAKSYVYKSPK
ncbi:PREDICTED: protein NRT1/ PTR FAMILY 5.12 [Camelina sativa]|uniref:Protein NRT1/ PTR FAMILY 5.12 n=1 Tax=Camelina sativa TaxID=90675 RepID=A0ABM0WHP6_CAMSA|nr:PREDICTED: protein NRT1/ PTR FAMILY 5.12 [Camelina sativa]